MLTKEEYEKAEAELDALFFLDTSRVLTPEECARWDELSDAIDAYEKANHTVGGDVP